MTTITMHPKSRQVINVLQITDTHLFADSDGRLLGLNTEQSLQAVMQAALPGRPSPDLVLATGDLVHDGTPESYRRIFGHLEKLGAPVYCLAGSEGGHLDRQALETLDRLLAGAPDRHALVCLHHQPVPMGSRWLDSMAVDNADEFFEVIDRHPSVRGILWGHVHQSYDSTRGDIRLMATPSTCIQFLPGSDDFALDTATPGYRRLSLYPDGRIETCVERLEETPGVIDMASAGY